MGSPSVRLARSHRVAVEIGRQLPRHCHIKRGEGFRQSDRIAKWPDAFSGTAQNRRKGTLALESLVDWRNRMRKFSSSGVRAMKRFRNSPSPSPLLRNLSPGMSTRQFNLVLPPKNVSCLVSQRLVLPCQSPDRKSKPV